MEETYIEILDEEQNNLTFSNINQISHYIIEKWHNKEEENFDISIYSNSILIYQDCWTIEEMKENNGQTLLETLSDSLKAIKKGIKKLLDK